jgi:hypothetical protein
MSELQQHTEKRHQSLTDDAKTSSFFSEANGYWLSIHPENYARLIKPTFGEETAGLGIIC